jgi:hypothetical protein
MYSVPMAIFKFSKNDFKGLSTHYVAPFTMFLSPMFSHAIFFFHQAELNFSFELIMHSSNYHLS